MNRTGNVQSKRANSVPRYLLIGKDGDRHGPFTTAIAAAEFAAREWPGQEQDEDRIGLGWDIEIRR